LRLLPEILTVRSNPVHITLCLAAIMVLASCSKSEPQKPAQGNAASASQADAGKGVDRSHRGTAAPDASFANGDGEQTSITDIADGRPLLVNLWASWCAPCVKELPTLDRLSQMPNRRLKVIAISQDSGPHASVEAFLTTNKIVNLEAYQDKSMAVSGALNAQVLPTTILYDGKGHEVWRYVGDLDWTSRQAAKLLSEAGV
jgi:thiol-disulfide isomerase/thioredoxin